MKILHILDSPDRGGTETLALDLCCNARNNDLDLFIVVTRRGALDEAFRSSGVDYQLIERKMPIDLGLILELKKIVQKKDIKIIHAHQAVDGLHAYLTKKITNVKTVLSFHGHIPSLKDDFVLKFLIPRMNANIAVSNSFLDRLKHNIKFDTSRNFHVIHNGIDAKKFSKTDRSFRRELHLTNSDILLGMVGNFYNDGRDQLTICKALPPIFNLYPNLHFAFVGGRSDTKPHFFDECYNFCRDKNILNRTHFVGLRSDINDILNSLDIFVFSSNHDTFGIAVIEAMMAGLPTIINDIPPLLEVSNNGKYSKVFKSKFSDDLTNKLIELISDHDEKIKLASEGNKWALSRFSIEKYISNLKNLYESLLNTDKKYVKSNKNK